MLEIEDRPRDLEFVLRTADERRVRFVRLWFVDVLGLLKSVAIPVTELGPALEEGVPIDGSALDGFARGDERDLVLVPDPATFQVLPWRPGNAVARLFCDVRTLAGGPASNDSRHVLRTVLSDAADAGWTLGAGAEVEFFAFEEPCTDAAVPRPLDDGSYFDLTPQDDGTELRRRSIEYLERMGVPVMASHHEVAPSQHELDLAPSDPLSMGDAITTLRVAVRQAAREEGIHATFMPKPTQDVPGSGMHLHLSLFADGTDALATSDARDLTPAGGHFLAGILAHAGELSLLTNQWSNSYRRLVPGFEAPEVLAWTRVGRSALVRLPGESAGSSNPTRFEVRSPDPACNPYLALAGIVAAGLRGIEREYGLPGEDVPAHGGLLPVDLREACERFAGSELARDLLGDRFCEALLRNKRADLERERRAVPDHERRALLRVV